VRSTTGMPEPSRTDLLMRYQRAQAQFTDRVDAVEAAEWDVAALPEWSVADLVAHLTSEQLWVPPLLAGEPLQRAADAALTAWAADGALERTVHLYSGPAAAADYLTELTADLTVHAWDLASAVGRDTQLDAELVAAAFAYAERNLDDDGVPGIFAPPVDVPPGADLQTRLLARFGRRA
jgi:uncharacterized protein (TIGR03083 family)